MLVLHLAQIDISNQAGDLASNALANAQQIQQSVNSLWDSVANGSTYKALCVVGANVSILTMLFFLYEWKKRSDENGFSWDHVSHFIWPVIVMWLLITSPGNPTGEHLWSFTIAIKNFINNADTTVLASVSNTSNLALSRHQAAMASALDSQIKTIYTQCQSFTNPDERKKCFDDKRPIIEQWKSGAGDNKWTQAIEAAWQGAYNTVINPYEAVSNAANVNLANLYENAITELLKGLVLAMGTAFSYILQISLLLTAMLGPIAVGASLIPLPTKPILAWLTTMFSIGIAQISFDIVTGLMADVMINSTPADAMPYILFTGLLAPILAIALASGGGIAVFSGLTAGVAAGAASLNAGLASFQSRSARRFRVRSTGGV